MTNRLTAYRLTTLLALALLLVPATTSPQLTDSSPRPAPGQTATLLADGRWLLLGGEGKSGPMAHAAIWDPHTRSTVPLTAALSVPRAWHTATVLPDGDVLILGGLGATGQVLAAPELLDPRTGSVQSISIPGLTPRAHHSATLLTDGRVLLAGGVSGPGQVLEGAELWAPLTGALEPVAAPMAAGRTGHTASLLPDGTVLLWGGTDPADVPLPWGEIFDPASGSFARVTTMPATPSPSDPPQLQASFPLSDAADVPVDSLIALRLSKPLRVDTVNATTVTLSGPQRPVSAQVVAAEGGLLVFVTPESPLAPGAQYTVAVNGAEDGQGVLLPFTSLRFATAQPVAVPSAPGRTGTGVSSTSSHAAHAGVVSPTPGTAVELDEYAWKGERRHGQPYSRWQALPPLQAPAGVTALSGQVLRLNGQPLAEVTLRIGARSARTDATGRFLLTALPAGQGMLIMDGSTASAPGKTYGTFDYGVTIRAGVTTVLPFTIWLPLIDTAHAVQIPVPTASEVVVTSPRIPGLEMRIPAGVILRDHAGQPLQAVGLTELPVDRPPFPLPGGSRFFFTPQTHGARVERPDGSLSSVGVRFVMPNIEQLAPGVRIDLWNYSPRGGWQVYGQGTVRRDGRQIWPDPEAEFFHVGCALPMGSEGAAPAAGPKPGASKQDGEPVDLGRGSSCWTRWISFSRTCSRSCCGGPIGRGSAGPRPSGWGRRTATSSF